MAQDYIPYVEFTVGGYQFTVSVTEFYLYRGESEMGFIHIDVDVANPAAPDVSESVRVLVDTGATLSVLPADLLDRLGVRRRYRRRLQGFGGVVTRDTGTVNMSYEDSEEGVTVVFGNEDDPPIMGVTALETLGFEVDPVNGRLNRVDMLVM